MSTHPPSDPKPTERFSNRAADYVKFRPSYPSGAIDFILSGLGPADRITCADIGAGTGISSRLLADRHVRVLAIEPNAAMRTAAEPHPLVEYRDGTAEQTNLPDSGVQLVLCAQAFHWFKQDQALREFHRILTPTGRLALVWNDRDNADALTKSYNDAIILASRDHPTSRPFAEPRALFESSLFADKRSASFPSVQELDLEGLIGRATSASYVPKSGPAFDRMVNDLSFAHAKYADPQGLVRLAHQCKVYIATRKA